MRWNAEKPKWYETGDKRTLTKFAWKKVKIQDKWVWFEFYEQDQIYFRPAGGGPGWWTDEGRRFAVFYV